jgi:hypothetical protein
MKKCLIAVLAFVLALSLAMPALAASGWDKPEEETGTYAGFSLTVEKYEYYPSVSGGYPADGTYYPEWDDAKGIVRDTRGRVVFTVTIPDREDLEALYPGVNFHNLKLTFTITNVKGVAEVDLYNDPVDYTPDFLTNEIKDNVFTHEESLGKEKKSSGDGESYAFMYVFSAAGEGDVVASVSLTAGSDELGAFFTYQSDVIDVYETEGSDVEYGEWIFLHFFTEANGDDGLIFDTDDSDKVQRLFLVLFRPESEQTIVYYQVLVDINGEIAFKDGDASVQEGDEGYAPLKAQYDFFMGALDFEWDGSVKYMNEKLILQNAIPHASGKASATFPGGYQAIVTPTAMPPQTGDRGTVAGYAMLALAALAAVYFALRRHRA